MSFFLLAKALRGEKVVGFVNSRYRRLFIPKEKRVARKI